MPQYGAPWQALLQPPEQQDMVRNPEYDRLVGLDEQSGDDDATKFMKGYQSTVSRNTPEGRQLTMEVAKAQLANQMAMQLEQQKLQLKQQYPEYQIIPTKYGAVAINPMNPNQNTKVESYPGAAADYGKLDQAQMAAQTATAQTQADPDVQAANKQEAINKPKLVDAQTQAALAEPGLRAAQIKLDTARAQAAENRGDNLARGKAPDRAEIAKEVNGYVGYNPSKPYMTDPDVVAKIPQMVEDLYNKRMQQWRSGGASSGTAAPQSNQVTPDLSNLLQPLGQ